MHRKHVLKTAVMFLITALVFFTCAVTVTETEKIVDAQTPEITESTASFFYKIGSDLPVLSVTVTPVTDGGELSYQWYEFDFEKGIGNKITTDGDDASFTPPAITEERPGRPYRYYVEVTNYNANANGRKRVAVSATVDIIAYDENNAQMPRILRQPAGNEAFLSPRMSVLITMSSDVADGGVITYQWYKAKGIIAENGEPIDGATSAAINLKRDIFPEDVAEAEGTYFFFVVATNTNNRVTGRRETKTISDVAAVTVTRSKDAAAPDILEQPTGAILFVGDALTADDIITVEADAEDGGDLTYQWYRNTTNANTGGTALSGATAATYRITGISTASAASYFYYVIVTNTNNDVTVNKVNTTTSNTARVTVQSSTVPTAPGIDLEVDFTKKYQYVRGFGGMDVAWANFPTYKMEDYENMYNPDKLGYNMLRIMIPPNYTDINRTMEELVANKISGAMDRSNYYEFVKVVNKYGGYVLASPWTPPAAWKTNNSVNGGGELRRNNYQDFADYLRTYCQIMADHGAPIYAVALQNEPTWVAGYDGCEYTPAQNRDFFLQSGHFTKNYRGSYNPVPGYGGGKEQPFVRTMDGESHNEIATFHEPAMRNKTSRDAIDIVGAHIYGAGPRHYSMATLTDANGDGEWTPTGAWNPTAWRPALKNGSGTGDTDAKEIWMTEHNINGGNAAAYVLDSSWEYIWKFLNDVDLVIRHNQENAFIWWSAKRFYSMIGDGSYSTTDGAITPRGYALSHYARFAKETGMVAVKASGYLGDDKTKVSPSNVNNVSYTNDDTSAKISAFVTLKDGSTKDWRKDRDDITLDDISAISLVMYTPTNTGTGGFDLGNVKIKLPDGFIIRDAVLMRSTSQVKQQMEAVTINPDRNTAYVNLPKSNVVSVRFTKQ